jgi:tetratricopeptide (TPR) repeat protein
MQFRFLSFGIILTVLFSCASSPAKKPSQGLYGMIYDGNNRPVKEVKVYVGNAFSAVSDIHGHFSLANLKTGKNYRIRACKENYEEAGIDVYYADPSMVLYISMSHRDQLLGQAEQALRDKDWALAESLLSRADAAGGPYSPTQYLRGILAFHRGEYDAALGILLKLGETEKNAPYLWLFIADLYQYHLGDKEQAAAFLNKFLEAKYDAGLAARVRELIESET